MSVGSLIIKGISSTQILQKSKSNKVIKKQTAEDDHWGDNNPFTEIDTRRNISDIKERRSNFHIKVLRRMIEKT